MAPSLVDDFTTESIFSRQPRSAPLAWTGTMPPELVRRMIEILPSGVGQGRPQR